MYIELQLSMYSIDSLRLRLVWGPESRISHKKGVTDFCYGKKDVCTEIESDKFDTDVLSLVPYQPESVQDKEETMKF